MPLTSKLRLRYQRRVGFPGYSHLELEIEEEIIMEEGDAQNKVVSAVFEDMGMLVKAGMQPVVDLYKTATGAQPVEVIDSPETQLQADAKAAAAAHERKEKAKARTGQPTLDGVLDEKLEDLPTEREPARDMPVYSEEGKRVRGREQKGFKMNEINVAWQALADAGIVSTKPDHSKEANTDRQDIRVWLKMTPLDPKFSQHELGIVIASYNKWRGQGLTTAEAMVEVSNDYIGVFRVDSGDGEDSGEPRSADQEAESSEDEAESVDQGAGVDGDTGSSQPGGEDAGPDDGTAKAEAE